MIKDIKQLNNKLDGLLLWKREKEEQQISFPMDYVSRRALTKDVVQLRNRGVSTQPFFYTDLLGLGLGLRIKGIEWFAHASAAMFPFTVNTTTDYITATNGEHGLSENMQIGLYSTGNLPTYFNGAITVSLSTIFPYYVVNITPTTFQIAESSGGTALDINTSGTGDLYFGRV